MGTFLLILKIIGIVLLSILGFVLFLLLVLLLMPITYKAEVSAEDGINAHGKVSWLFFINVLFQFVDNQFKLNAKVFWFSVFSIGDDKPEKEKTKKLKNKKSSDKDSINLNDSKQDDVKKSEEVSDNSNNTSAELNQNEFEKSDIKKAVENSSDLNKNDCVDETKTSEEIKEDESEIKTKKFGFNFKKKKAKEPADETVKSETTEDNQEETVKKSLYDKIHDKVLEIAAKIYEKILALYEKLESVFELLQEETKEVETFFKRKSTKYTLELLWKTVLKLLMHIRPRKLTGDLEVGFDDPATTGYLCAGLSLVYSEYEDKFDFTPDFSGKAFKGHAKLKGHIILGYIVCLALNLIIRKKVRMFIKNIKQLKNNALDRVDKAKNLFVS